MAGQSTTAAQSPGDQYARFNQYLIMCAMIHMMVKGLYVWKRESGSTAHYLSELSKLKTLSESY